MTKIHIAIFTAENRKAILAALLVQCGLRGFEAKTATSGKPYLQAADGSLAGLAITHVRKAEPPISIMAVSENPALGLDAEVWPEVTDATFLASILAPEDAALIAKARQQGRDPATLLWVLKEAALKASGEVMHDPRQITVGVSPKGHIQATISAAATAPLPRCKLWVFDMASNVTNGAMILVVALAESEGRKTWNEPEFVCFQPSVELVRKSWQ